MSILKKYRFLLSRRILQTSLLLLFVGGNIFGWTILRGNYNSALILNTVPLSDPYAVLQMLFTGFISSLDLIIGGILVLLIYGLITGRMFCSWVCPMNVITETASYTRKKTGITTHLKFSRKTRYGILILGLILSTILGFSAFEAISPISMLHRGVIFGIGSGWAIVLAIFLFDISITKDGWCGHLCPLGALYSIIGKYAILKVKHDKDKCTDCLKCFKVCHEEQVLNIIGTKTGFITSGECTNCARCIEVCDDKALYFSLSNTLKQHVKS